MRTFASGAKIKVDNPIVDLDGDEMTRWGKVLWPVSWTKLLCLYTASVFILVEMV